MRVSAEPAFSLSSLSGEDPPALLGVEARGRLDGVLLSLTLRQTYRNDTAEPLEVVYTFPLPHGAVLLGLAAEFDGQRLTGHVLPASSAEQTYERALADGDAPVLLEVAADGLHTASLGNLKAGETVTLEVRLAQLLAFEQGRLRVSIPTTIAPRYGNPLRAGLRPHQLSEAWLAVEYALACSLAVTGSLARARIECPTHAHRLRPVDGGVQLELQSGATLDRDLVVVVTPEDPRPGLLLLGDDGPAGTAAKVALAALTLPERPMNDALCLRLLVDCSGSMGGDSIASARAALRGVLDGLNDEDELSLSRFGSSVRHVVGAGRCAPPQRLRLRAAIDQTDADLGGTEMQAALESVFAAWPRKGRRVDVLLITDGEVWQAEELVAAARRSAHRVFAIGVGSSPAESVLRQLAEATGGVAEFVTPGEAVEHAAARMLARMRQQPATELAVDWGAQPAWQLPLPRQAFGGDTVLALAGFSAALPDPAAVRLRGVEATGRPVELARAVSTQSVSGQDLARLAAASRLRHCDEAEQLQLALDYQLVSSLTHCVLVHERADEDRVSAAARLQRVPSMLAAGWGASSSVDSCAMSLSIADLSPAAYSVLRSARAAGVSARLDSFDDMDDFDDDDLQMAAPARAKVDPAARLRELMRRVAQCLADGGTVADLVIAAQDWEVLPEVEQALARTDRLGIGRAVVWLLLAQWIASRQGGDDAREPAVLFAGHAGEFDDADRQAAWEVFDELLAALEPGRNARTSRAGVP